MTPRGAAPPAYQPLCSLTYAISELSFRPAGDARRETAQFKEPVWPEQHAQCRDNTASPVSAIMHHARESPAHAEGWAYALAWAVLLLTAGHVDITHATTRLSCSERDVGAQWQQCDWWNGSVYVL
jgi:hypothetical protein